MSLLEGRGQPDARI